MENARRRERLGRILKRLILFVVLADSVFLAALYLYPPTLAPALAVAGDSGTCGWLAGSRGLRTHYCFTSGAKAIAEKCSEIRQDPAGFHLWDTPSGRFWIPADSDSVLPILISQQLERIYGKIHAGDVVLDCGAHIGLYTREALKMGARLVVAIEPAPDNVECLRRNFVSEIQAGRVIVYPKGVWDKEDVLQLRTVSGNSAGDSFVLDLGPGERISVPLTTIDNIVSELDMPRVDFIKMDIKGAERQALTGARQTLAKYRPRLSVASEHMPDDPELIPAIIRSSRPDYQVRCGSCFLSGYRIRPEILHFD